MNDRKCSKCGVETIYVSDLHCRKRFLDQNNKVSPVLMTRKHRVTHCHSCKEPLDNSSDTECNICGWIICGCGACRYECPGESKKPEMSGGLGWDRLLLCICTFVVSSVGLFCIGWYAYRPAIAHASLSVRKLTNEACDSLPVDSYREKDATATIDTDSLVTYSTTPTISGTFSNAGAISVLIWKGRLVLPSGALGKEAIWREASDHGGQLWQCPIGSASGRFSGDVNTPLQEGEYTVGVYTYDTIYNPGYQGNTPSVLLATGVLKVITQESLERLQEEIERLKQQPPPVVIKEIPQSADQGGIPVITPLINTILPLAGVAFLIFIVGHYLRRWRETTAPERALGKSVRDETASKEARERLETQVKMRIDMENQKQEEWAKYTVLEKEIRAMPRYAVWRQDVLARYNGKCAVGDLECMGNPEVDHFPKSLHSIVKSCGIQSAGIQAIECTALWDVNNGQALCSFHHPQTTSSRYRASKS